MRLARLNYKISNQRPNKSFDYFHVQQTISHFRPNGVMKTLRLIRRIQVVHKHVYAFIRAKNVSRIP